MLYPALTNLASTFPVKDVAAASQVNCNPFVDSHLF